MCHLSGITAVVSPLQKCYRRAIKILKGSKTLATETKDHHLPEASSSIEQLRIMQDSITKNLVWVQDMNSEFKDDPLLTVSESSYNKVLQLFFASLYVFSAQGRINAIHLLDYEDGVELYTRNQLMSEYFKTKRKFGFQPIIIASISIKLFRFYWEVLRPMISQQLCAPKDPLWLTFGGERFKNIGSKIKIFFLNNLQINTTTTKLRSLIDTVASSLHK